MNMRIAQGQALSAHGAKCCGGGRCDLGFGGRTGVVYLEADESRDEAVQIHWRMLCARADGWGDCEEAAFWRGEDGGYIYQLAGGKVRFL